ncbi:MAG: hypothetical protein BEN18_11435 [Epulopiscium sp. Nuni2H_MBin001]|nr:MAG: hypothetical protein BEN18_11435 [Epulopiscium sp. Nuni2H_MBin001]
MLKKAKYLLATTLVLCAVGCSSADAEVEAASPVELASVEIIDILEAGDTNAIATLILGDMAEVFSEEEDMFFDLLLPYVEISVDEITDTDIVYEITSPDISNIFVDLLASEEAMAAFEDDDGEQFMNDYVEQAESITELISVPYEEIDGEVTIDYSQDEFIYAITGGIFEAYINFVYAIMFDALDF